MKKGDRRYVTLGGTNILNKIIELAFNYCNNNKNFCF